MSSPDLKKLLLDELVRWYESHRSAKGEEPNRNVVCAGLAVLEEMRKNFPLTEDHYITKNNQVKTSNAKIKKILARYGENRAYSSEAGRTTRSTRTAAERLVARINGFAILKTSTVEERAILIDALQSWLAGKATEYFERQKIVVEINLERPGCLIVGDILATANARKQAGQVAQHLVGAKLALRYPKLRVENHSFTTADAPTGRGGDFSIHDTIFHVTMVPMPAVVEKCGVNVRNGYRSILLVPKSKTDAARQMAETAELHDKIGIFAIESFVGQNIEEISEFAKVRLAKEFRALLDKYNQRVAAVETDRSLLIEIPENL